MYVNMEKAKILPCGFTRREENGIIKADKEKKCLNR